MSNRKKSEAAKQAEIEKRLEVKSEPVTVVAGYRQKRDQWWISATINGRGIDAQCMPLKSDDGIEVDWGGRIFRAKCRIDRDDEVEAAAKQLALQVQAWVNQVKDQEFAALDAWTKQKPVKNVIFIGDDFQRKEMQYKAQKGKLPRRKRLSILEDHQYEYGE